MKPFFQFLVSFKILCMLLRLLLDILENIVKTSITCKHTFGQKFGGQQFTADKIGQFFKYFYIPYSLHYINWLQLKISLFTAIRGSTQLVIFLSSYHFFHWVWRRNNFLISAVCLVSNKWVLPFLSLDMGSK